MTTSTPVPSVLIATFSQTGTTTRIALQIAAGLRAAGWQVDRLDISPGAIPDLRGVDLLGIGTPTYFYRPPFIVQDFVQALPPLDGRASFVFCLHGTHQGNCGNQIRARLRAKGARDVGYFLSFGADYWQGYLKQGVLSCAHSPICRFFPDLTPATHPWYTVPIAERERRGRWFGGPPTMTSKCTPVCWAR